MTESNVFFGEAGLIPGMSATTSWTWEKSDQYNLSDLDLLDYRLKVGLDYYYKYSYALLLQTPTPGDVYFVDKMWNNASAWSLMRDLSYRSRQILSAPRSLTGR